MKYWLVLLIVFVGSPRVVEGQDCAPKPTLDCFNCPSPVSLECLIVLADRILVGRVSENRHVSEEIKLAERFVKFPVRYTTLKPVYFFKPSTGATEVTIRRYDPVYHLGDMPEGRFVFLFLVAESQIGFDGIVGNSFPAGLAGLFKPSSENQDVLLVSGQGNSKLWGTQLWTSTLTREQVAEKMRGLPISRIDGLLGIGDRSARDEPLPFNFLTAVIDAKLAQLNRQK